MLRDARASNLSAGSEHLLDLNVDSAKTLTPRTRFGIQQASPKRVLSQVEVRVLSQVEVRVLSQVEVHVPCA